MTKAKDKRLREGALSSLRTPEKPPAPGKLTPARSVQAAPGEAQSGQEDPRVAQQAVLRAKAGDVEALSSLYGHYADDVRRYVNGLVRDAQEADEITQNVFAKLESSISKYDERAVPFDAWILRVARNSALDHLRAKRAIPTGEIDLADTGRSDTALGRGRALRQVLEDLPEDQREVLVLRHIVGLSPREIAQTLQKSESSVHGLHHQGRRTLRESLTNLEESTEAT